MKAELFNFRCWIDCCEPDLLKELMYRLLNKAEFEILGFQDHHFQPIGYTGIWLLGESHLAVHTFPEENKTYVELTSCVKSKKDVFAVLLQNEAEIQEQLS